MLFKVEYEIQITEDEAEELAEGEGTDEEYTEDKLSTTENNIKNIIEESVDIVCIVDKVHVNYIL